MRLTLAFPGWQGAIPLAMVVLLLAGCAGDPAGPSLGDPPVAAAGGPYTGHEGTAVTFDGTASTGTGQLTYAWTFGDGRTGTGARPTHTYEDDGVFTVVLTVTDAEGRTSRPDTTTAVIANVPPSVDLTLSSNAVVVGEALTVTGSFTDPGVLDSPWHWQLDWGDGTTETGSASSTTATISATRSYAAPGTYTIRLTVRDKDGGEGVVERAVEVGHGAPVRVVTFGNSNTDGGWDGRDPEMLVRSYVSRMPLRLLPTDPHDPRQLAGKIEAAWKAIRLNPITVVNHGIGGTTTGGGGFGGSDRLSSGSPHSRTQVDGITRFEAEVLGRGGATWHGGEPTNQYYPDGPVPRTHAFVPGPNDFAYLSMGTNDPTSGITTAQTIENLQWMAAQWIDAGLSPSHLLVTTLPPREPQSSASFPAINEAIRKIGTEKGVHVIDLAAYTSDDDGLTWKSDELHVGDRLHYSEAVRDWLAQQVVTHMRALIPGPERSILAAAVTPPSAGPETRAG
jgi:PKD repeat protein